MRGRKPTPTALHALHGSPGKRKPPPGEPKPATATGLLAPPAHLGKDAAGEWRRITGELKAVGLVSRLDLGLLAAWCAAYGDFVQAERALKRGGLVKKGDDGVMRRNPWLMVKSKAVEQMVRIGSEFGLSPASRPRLGRIPAGGIEGDHGTPNPAADNDALDQHLASRPKLVH